MTANTQEVNISSGAEIPARVMTITTAGTSQEVKTKNSSLILSTPPTLGNDNWIARAVKVEMPEPYLPGRWTISRRLSWAT